MWAGGQLLFPDQANGSLIVDPDGTIRGSALLAQNFTADKYFQPRPSAAGTGYDAANSSGTNLGPTSRKLADAIQAAVAAYRTENHLAADALVPADAVTSSGSGLDPHISVANAELQAARVAQARELPVARVQALIAAHTDGSRPGPVRRARRQRAAPQPGARRCGPVIAMNPTMKTPRGRRARDWSFTMTLLLLAILTVALAVLDPDCHYHGAGWPPAATR